MLEIPEVTNAEIAFPTTVPLPAWDDIPEEMRRNWHNDPWCNIVSSIFFNGGKLTDFGLTPKKGVDLDKAMRVIRACLGSWEPSHEHKTAGVAFMLSEWFDRK